MRKGKATLIVICVVLGLTLLWVILIAIGDRAVESLKASFPTPTLLETHLREARIMPADLPAGWRLAGESYDDIPGALTAFTVAYNGAPGKSWVKVSQQVTIYPNVTSAAMAYQETLQSFSKSWISPPGLTFTGNADEMYITCIPAYIDGLHIYSCVAVGLYGDTLSTLWANVFEEQWLTMGDFEKVLEAMDRRVLESSDQSD